MLDLSVRVTTAARASPSVAAGRTSERSPAIGSSHGSMYPEIGSHRSVTPKTKISRSAMRKLGMQMPNSANEVPKRSTAVLRRAAERMPTGVATTREMAIASPRAEARSDPAADVLDHRLLVADRPAQVAAQDPSHPGDVLEVERLVEPQLLPEMLLDAGVDRLRHHGVDRIARRQVDQREDARADEQQDGDGREEATEDEAAHGGGLRAPPTSSRRP
jgi:hypothetical protein